MGAPRRLELVGGSGGFVVGWGAPEVGNVIGGSGGFVVGWGRPGGWNWLAVRGVLS